MKENILNNLEGKVMQIPIDENLNGICRWIYNAKIKKFEILSKEKSIPGMYFREEIAKYEKKGGLWNPRDTRRMSLLESDDGIQNYIFSLAAPYWEGGWEGKDCDEDTSGMLNLSYKNVINHQNISVQLNMQNIVKIAKDNLKKLSGISVPLSKKEIDFLTSEEGKEFKKHQYNQRKFEMYLLEMEGQIDMNDKFKYFEILKEWERKEGNGSTGLVDWKRYNENPKKLIEGLKL